MPTSDQVQHEDNSCIGIEDISIIFNNKLHHHKKRKKIRFVTYRKRKLLQAPFVGFKRDGNRLSQPCSMPILKDQQNVTKLEVRRSDTIMCKVQPYCSKYVANLVPKHRDKLCLFGRSPAQASFQVYRCQISTADDSCCCACNSDAMFEVMKSLYDCYKRKDCNHCDCILCGHLPREERLKGEMRKELKTSVIGIGTELTESGKMLRKEKAEKVEKQFIGKTLAEKEAILKGIAASGTPLPELKSLSDKALVKKVKMEMGLPSEPKTAAEKEKLKKAEAAGTVSKMLKKEMADKVEKQFVGKTLAEKEAILKELAVSGTPLPELKSPSDKALVKKVTMEMGLPPEPRTAAEKEKLKKAEAAGAIVPLEGKTQAQKKNILKKQAEMGIVLPEGRTASEKKLISDIKTAVKEKPSEKAQAEAFRKAKEEKEEVQKKLPMKGEIQLKKKVEPKVSRAEVKIPSEKALVTKEKAAIKMLPPPKVPTKAEKRLEVKPATIPEPKILTTISKGKAEVPPPAAKVKAKEAEITLEEKPSEQKEKMLRNLVKQQLPLPEAKTASGKKLVSKIRTDLGLPTEPKTLDQKEKYAKAQAAGIIVPLEGKTTAEKEKILDREYEAGIPLPEGRTSSEKDLIKKIKALKKKTKARIEKAQKLEKETSKVMKEAKGPSDECICDILAPVTEKVPSKVIEKRLPPAAIKLSEKVRKAKAAGFMTPLEGKSPEQKEKILKGLVKHGLPLPEAKTASDKKIIQKVRTDVGLPPEPKTSALKEKYAKAQSAGIITPLEGKSPAQKEKILKALLAAGLPLPEGQTPSEKAFISKIKAEGLTKQPSLEGKSSEQKEKLLKDLIQKGKPLPEVKSASDKKLVDKVKADMGLPPEPKTLATKEKYEMARAAGIIQPLEGKTNKEKEEILIREYDAGIPLPVARTISENEIITKIVTTKGKPRELSKKAKKLEKISLKAMKEGKGPSDECICSLLMPEFEKPPSTVSSVTSEIKEKFEKLAFKKTKLTLEGKSFEEKEKMLKELVKKGKPLPPVKTASDKKMLDRIRADMGLPMEPKPSEKYAKALAAGLVSPLEGKRKTPSEKILAKKKKAERPTVSPTVSEKIRKAKAAGFVPPPLEGKTSDEMEELLRKLIKQQIPLPEAKTVEERKVLRRVRYETGLPPEAKNYEMKQKYERAYAMGVIVPLEGKSHAEKEKILIKEYEAGIPLPKGRTSSEKELIKKIKATKKLDTMTSKVVKEGKGPSDECICVILTPESEKGPSKVSEKGLSPAARKISEKIRKARDAGLLTPLEGKSPEQKEKILKGLVKHGVPLPEGKTASDKKIIHKVRTDLGLPPEPKSLVLKDKYAKAQAAGIITPLEGKSTAQKEKILKALIEAGLPLPEARMSTEKALITKIKTERSATKISEKREKELRDLVKQGKPLPEGKTPSEKKAIDKIKAEMGLPLELKPSALKEKYNRLDKKTLKIMKEAKGPSDECICGLLTSESEKFLPKPLLVKEKVPTKGEEKGLPSAAKLAEKKRKVKTAVDLSAQLEGKSRDQKEKILKDALKQGQVLPEGKTASDKKLIDKIRADMGLPPEPKTSALKVKYAKAQDAGIITPLEGKSTAQKEKILKSLIEAGLPLPEGRMASEKALITKIKAERSAAKVSEKREKELRDLVQQGKPLPEGKTPSEKKIIGKIKAEMGLPLESKPSALKEMHNRLDKRTLKVMKEGKGPSDECICGLLTTESEKILPKPLLVKEKVPAKGDEKGLPSTAKLAEKKRKVIAAADLSAQLEGKSRDQKEKILKDALKQGQVLPEGKTASDKKLLDKIRADMGLPPEPKTSALKVKYAKAQATGIITPLEGKSTAQKEKILKAWIEAGLPLPEGRMASEKALIAKIKAERSKPEKIADVRKIKSEELAKQKAEKLRKAKALKKPFPEKVPSAKPSIVRSLTGRTPSQMEKISKGLAGARLERKAVSEKSLKKVRAAKKKTRKTGEGAKEMKAAKEISVAAEAKHKGGIAAKFEEITKTTTCDQGCGCDTRKIRFKHSYVKIMVTSPDISTLCPCPNDCIPRTKEGVFVDNDGIKVTIGRAIGAPSYRKHKKNRTYYNQSVPEIKDKYNFLKSSMSSIYSSYDKISESYVKSEYVKCLHKRNALYANSEESLATEAVSYDSNDNIWNYIKRSKISDKSSASKYLITCSDDYGTPLTISWSSLDESFDDAGLKSSHVLFVVKTNSSLSFSSKFSSSIETISVTSFHKSSITSSCHCLLYPDSNRNAIHTEESKYSTSKIDNTFRRSGSENDLDLRISKSDKIIQKNKISTKKDLYDVVILRIETNLRHSMNVKKGENHKEDNADPIAVIKDVNSEFDISKIIDTVIAKEKYISKSSILVLVPFSGENLRSVSDSASSTICLRLSENLFKSHGMPLEKLNDTVWPYQGLKIEVKGKLFDMYGQDTSYSNVKYPETNSEGLLEPKNYQCSSRNGVEILENTRFHENFSMDTTQDRPCCCTPPVILVSTSYASFSDNIIHNPVITSHSTSTSMRKVVFDEPEFESTEESKYFLRKHFNMGTYVVSLDSIPCCSLMKTKSSVDMKVKANTGNSIAREIISPIIRSHRIEQGISEDVCDQDTLGINTPHHKKCLSPSRGTQIGRPQYVVYQAKRSKRDRLADKCPCRFQTGTCFVPEPPAPAAPCTCNTCTDKNNSVAAGESKETPAMGFQEECWCTDEATLSMGFKGECLCTDEATLSTGFREEGSCTDEATLSTGEGFKGEGSCTPNAPYPRIPTAKPTKKNSTGISIKIVKELACQAPMESKLKPPAVPPPPVAKDIAIQSDPLESPCFKNVSEQSAPPESSCGNFSGQHDSINENKKDTPCTCTSAFKRKRKKVQCDCPPKELLDWDIDSKDTNNNVSEEPVMKINSEMTQTTSGFNFKFQKRPVEVQMSFEDAIAYFEQYEPEEEHEKKAKKWKKKKKDTVECQCPYIPEPPAPIEDLKGFKIFIGGKGSASKGVAGVMCCRGRSNR